MQFALITDSALCPEPQQIIDRFEPEFEKLLYLTLMLPWAGQDGACLAVVRTGQAYLAAYLPSGVAPEKAAGKVLSGIVKPWPASLSRPEALAPWVLDTTADEPSWFVGALVAGFAGICAWQLAKAGRRKLARR